MSVYWGGSDGCWLGVCLCVCMRVRGPVVLLCPTHTRIHPSTHCTVCVRYYHTYPALRYALLNTTSCVCGCMHTLAFASLTRATVIENKQRSWHVPSPCAARTLRSHLMARHTRAIRFAHISMAPPLNRSAQSLSVATHKHVPSP